MPSMNETLDTVTTRSRVIAAINAALGTAPAYWTPGVAAVGWTLHVDQQGSAVTVNRQLGAAYKQRLMDGLPPVFLANQLAVALTIGDAR